MIQVGNSWDPFLKEETERKYFKDIEAAVKRDDQKYVLCPRKKDRYTTFAMTPRDKVKVVIFGEAPFLSPARAHGLAFSSAAYDMPTSTRNLFRKIQDELKIQCYDDSNLERWAKQGVLLLNENLTRRVGFTRRNEGIQWDCFTYSVLKDLYQDVTPKVFILLGTAASARGYLGEKNDRHLLLIGELPDTSSFFFHDYFQQTNEFLREKRREVIDWR